ncbi:hypothetical protein EII19_08735 [Comamonadaceae bacterium OH2310_COT-174]|nr:hypothetical protein EII19_08735 [Comamonadaceae bacterium OH2310_COT-174]
MAEIFGWLAGVAETGLAKRFFEAKAANARRKCVQDLYTLQAFSTRQLRVLSKNTAAMLNLNPL